ncbi:unnamed protein product, partial [Protopolystoma xenopodis]
STHHFTSLHFTLRQLIQLNSTRFDSSHVNSAHSSSVLIGLVRFEGTDSADVLSGVWRRVFADNGPQDGRLIRCSPPLDCLSLFPIKTHGLSPNLFSYTSPFPSPRHTHSFCLPVCPYISLMQMAEMAARLRTSSDTVACRLRARARPRARLRPRLGLVVQVSRVRRSLSPVEVHADWPPVCPIDSLASSSPRPYSLAVSTDSPRRFANHHPPAPHRPASARTRTLDLAPPTAYSQVSRDNPVAASTSVSTLATSTATATATVGEAPCRLIDFPQFRLQRRLSFSSQHNTAASIDKLSGPGTHPLRLQHDNPSLPTPLRHFQTCRFGIHDVA